MGFSLKLNWVLQVCPPESLDNKGVYPFTKSGNRVFPLDTPIDLIDLDRVAIAKIRIQSFTNEGDETTGIFEVVKIYSGVEKSVLSNYWLENK